MAAKTEEKKRDTVDLIIAWEQGELSNDETIDFFSRLFKEGTINHLQGCYGRTAAALIEAGLCVDTHNRLGKNPQAN